MTPDARGLRLARIVGTGALLIAGATGVALLLAQVMLQPPRRDLVELGLYLACSGVATVGIGWALIRGLERWARPSILIRFLAVTLVASAILVVNIAVLAQLMFISTDHDLQLLLATIAFSGIVAVWFSGWIASGTIGRIARITDGVRSLAGGKLGVSVDVRGNDEIARLAEDVNALSSRLEVAHNARETLERERRELTAAISHDLRTPLSTIKAMIDALEDGVVAEPTDVKRYFVTIRRDIERLNRLIDDLFELAQIDAGAMRLRRRSLALQDIVAEVVDAMQARAARSGISLRLVSEDGIESALIDGDRMERAISNLLQNALEHTPSGGEVRVHVNSAEGEAIVEVRDSGEGIAEDDLPHIWKRFYRAEQSRSRLASDADGVGLGLAITKGIVELHGGSVAVQSQRGVGTSFVVRLPVADGDGG